MILTNPLVLVELAAPEDEAKRKCHVNLYIRISAYYHDSAACLLRDGDIATAVQEERFSRKKHDAGFPIYAIRHCLATAHLSLGDLEAIAFYDKPLVKFERLLETYLGFAPSGIRSFAAAMPVWIKEKLFLKKMLTIHIKRDTQLSIAYSEELIFSMSVTLQSTDRHHGIVG